MKKFRKFFISFILLIALCISEVSVQAATYCQTLTGKYTGGVPGSYKTSNEYTSNNQRANFRMVYGSAMGDGALYRSRNPYTTGTAAKIADSRLKKCGIRYVINLAASDEELAAKAESETYAAYNYTEMYKSGKVYSCNLVWRFDTDKLKKANREAMIKALKFIAAHRGPYLVHCELGKDRTGEFCIIAAAMCGATYNELLRDYRQSFRNYCSDASDAEITAFCKKNLDYILQLITYEPSGSNWSKMDLAFKVRRYLLQGGMTAAEICLAKRHLKCNY